MSAPHRPSGILCFDCDSTFITGEVLDLLAEEAGRGEEVAAVTARAMAGELDFEESLRTRVRALEGVDVAAAGRVAARLERTPGIEEAVAAARGAGFLVALASGGFTNVLDNLAPGWGVDHLKANTLEVSDGTFTGRVVGEIVDRQAKERELRALAERHGLPMARTVAVGDGANDIDMVTAAGVGVGYDPKPALAGAADLVLGSGEMAWVVDVVMRLAREA
ncbi:phosphoserine phosphatase SerB [Corynebacterium otitidis]|nr:phosphoserine phosphatase SerB [Corynebacterium otitidis]